MGKNLFLAIVLAALAHAGSNDIQEWYLDFRNERSLPLTVGTRDPRMDDWVRLGPEGLRVTLPAQRKKLHPVALDTDIGVRGDFEITAAYEVLYADVPEKGFGVGVLLGIRKASVDHQEARLGWLVRAKGLKVSVWDRSELQSDGQRKFSGGAVPFPAGKVGRLRLKRTGSQLQYLIAEGLDGDNFQAVKEWEFGPEDVERVALVVGTGRERRNFDVRWLDLRIRATKVPVVAEAPNNRGGWWFWSSLLAAVLFGGGFWGVRRRKRKLAYANKDRGRRRA